MGLFKNRKKTYIDKEINDKPKVKDAEMGVEELSFMGKGSEEDGPVEIVESSIAEYEVNKNGEA